MDLLIDIGNTNLKWASSAGGIPGDMQGVRHHGGLPIDLHAAWERLEAPERILVANVAGEGIASALSRTCRSRWARRPRFLQTQSSCQGVTIAYACPERLGVDRWLALIAAHQDCAGPVLILDAGTAITYDLMFADGRHLGGLILPGIDMMRDGLLARTQIPRVEPCELDAHWADDTGTAIAAGSVQAPAALAERLLERLTAEAGAVPELLLTGGDANRLSPAIHRPFRHQPELVLRGMALLLV